MSDTKFMNCCYRPFFYFVFSIERYNRFLCFCVDTAIDAPCSCSVHSAIIVQSVEYEFMLLDKCIQRLLYETSNSVSDEFCY